MIKVSVIVPVYKVPLEYLRACFDSLTAQTMQECEFIVVSDGAPEAECSICEGYVARDSRFKFFKREHAGVSATRNYGIDQAQGEYITFVDSDDWIEKEMCLDVYDFAKKNDSDVVFWDLVLELKRKKKYIVYSTNDIVSLPNEEIEKIQRATIYTSQSNLIGAISVCCKVIKKQILQRISLSFLENISICEDRLFFYTLFSQKLKVSYFKCNYYHYRIHSASTVHKYTPKSFALYTEYLNQIMKGSCENFQREVNSAFICSFFNCWNVELLHPCNSFRMKDKVQKIISTFRLPEIQNALGDFDKKSFSLLLRIELWLFEKEVYFPIYIHALKAELMNLFKFRD